MTAQLMFVPDAAPAIPLTLQLIAYFCILVVGFIAGVSCRNKVR